MNLKKKIVEIESGIFDEISQTLISMKMQKIVICLIMSSVFILHLDVIF